jgi:BMFP domain-containing protein YqiC
MTQTTGRVFDEIAKLMTDAAGAAQGVRREFETLMRSQAERMLKDLEVVEREEFEAVKAMAEKARLENERLAALVEQLVARVAALEGKDKPV